MKTLSICVGFILLTSFMYADDQTPEKLANAILQDRIALCPRIGVSKDDIFLKELDVNLYQAALDSHDKKLKALIAIKAISSMPVLLKPGEQPLSEEEKQKRLQENPDYKKLKAWYFDLIHGKIK